MPLKKDPQGGGSNVDGTRSALYCSYCYANGKFIDPNITAVQMQEKVKEILKGMGFPGLLAGMFVKGIPRLERWKNK